jgi:hypothetical protein
MSKETSVKLNRTAIAAESKSSFPADLTPEQATNADTLFSWLGSFWDQIYEDPEFIQYIQKARALRISQLYLDLLENLKLHDRENAPVFHRERWHPIILRRSQMGTGSQAMFRLTNDGTLNLGEQKNPVYPSGTVVTLGGVNVDLEGMVVYPLSGESSVLKSVLTCISNNIVDATVVLSAGRDFAVLDGAIAISKEFDPFTGDHADEFSKFEIVRDNPDDNDVETVLWACDSMFDRNFLYDNLGYAISLPTESKEVYKRVINAAWNIVASGATPLLVRSLMACICGVPTVKEEGEIVERIVVNDDSNDFTKQVITNKNVYSFSGYAELRKDVFVGAKLHRFDTLDLAIRVYPFTRELDRVPLYSEFVSSMDELMEDVPAVDMPDAYFRMDLDAGFSLTWNEVPVYCDGFDRNGNPKLRFDLEGSKEDNDIFWSDVQKAYEETGQNMMTCLGTVQDGIIVEAGKIVGSVSPLRFFFENLVGANTLVITVRTDTLADDAPLYDPKFFGVLRESIPSYIRLYVIEHGSVGDETVDLAEVYDDADLNIQEEEEDEFDYGVLPRGPKYHDHVDTKWIAACRDEYDD